MEKIKLTDNSKRILLELKNKKYLQMIPESDFDDINILQYHGLVEVTPFINNKLGLPTLTSKGETYILENPKLKNPSILDDKKYLITTLISLLSMIISIIALYKSI